jgi:hypothetical protein
MTSERVAGGFAKDEAAGKEDNIPRSGEHLGKSSGKLNYFSQGK